MTHPYHPPELRLQYTPNTLELWQLICGFGGALFVAAGSFWTLFLRGRKLRDSGTACWFFTCGLLHVFFEGYFIHHPTTLSTSNSLPAQLWKEYALSDSRYLTSNPFVLSIETLTVHIWGPLCFLASLSVAYTHASRHVLQLLVSGAHVYGCLLYFLTARIEGDRFCRPEGIYYWGYYVGANAPWIVVPLLLIRQSYGVLTAAVTAVEGSKSGKRE
ncbi:hypothetical protein RUND412_000769 [Rhizina undulata]